MTAGVESPKPGLVAHSLFHGDPNKNWDLSESEGGNGFTRKEIKQHQEVPEK